MGRLLLSLLLFATLTPGVAAMEVIKIGLSSAADPERSGEYVWAREFSESLHRSGLESVIYPGSALGNELVRSEQVLLGLLEVNVTGGQDLSDYSGLYATTELPFIFRSIWEVSALVESTDFLRRVNGELGPHGVLLIDQAYLGGLTGLFTARQPIRSIADMPNFRMRAMSSQQLDFFEAWGAAGTQVAWEEVPQALQTGIADGYLNAPIVPVLFGHGGQLDYFTDISMQPSMRSVVVSALWYENLSDKDRARVDQAIVDARAVLKAWVQVTLQKEFKMLNSIGIERIVLTTEQREMFRQRLLPMYTFIAPPPAISQMESYLAKIRAGQ